MFASQPLRTLVLVGLATASLNALPPLELTVLTQQYERAHAERVTTVYDTALASLNASFTTALGNAITQAKSAGSLETVLALEADKKRLAEKLPLPLDEDDTPEVQKKLRGIYRGQLTKLEEQRSANTAALLTPYVAKLKELEAILTKEDRVADAKTVLDYRQGLALNSSPAATPTAAPQATPMPPPVAAAAPVVKIPKQDPVEALEWILKMGGEIRHGTQQQYWTRIKPGDALPKGKFTTKSVHLSFQGKTPPVPVQDQDLDRLAAFEELESVSLNRAAPSGACLRFLTACPKVARLTWHGTPMGDEGFQYLATLGKAVMMDFDTVKITGAQLSRISHLPIEALGLSRAELEGKDLEHVAALSSLKELNLRHNKGIGDSGISFLRSCKKLESLDVTNTGVTVAALAGLQGLPLKYLFCGSPDAVWDQATFLLLAKTFPKLEGFGFPGEMVITKTDIVALGEAFPALTKVNLRDAHPEAGTLAALAAMPRLEKLSLYKSSTVTDAMIAELVAAKKLNNLDLFGTNLTDASLDHVATIKSLRYLAVATTKMTQAGVAAFKKKRPDVETYF